MMAMLVGMIAPAPNAWMMRATTSTSRLQAPAQSAEPNVKMASSAR